MALVEKFYVKLTQPVAISGVHYYPHIEPVEQKGKDGKVLVFKNQPYIYGKEACSKVEVSEQDFKYLITRNKAITACDKDVKFNKTETDLIIK